MSEKARADRSSSYLLEAWCRLLVLCRYILKRTKRTCTPPLPALAAKALMADRAHLYGQQSRSRFVKRESPPVLLSHSPPLQFGTRKTAEHPFAFSLQMPHPSSSASWDVTQVYTSPTMAHPPFTLAQDDYDDGDELGELMSVSGPSNGSSDRMVRRRSSKGERPVLPQLSSRLTVDVPTVPCHHTSLPSSFAVTFTVNLSTP